MIAQEWGELLALIDALIEGELSESDGDRLRTWLAVDEQAQEIYLRCMQLHADLAWTLGSPTLGGPTLGGPTLGGPSPVGGAPADAPAADAVKESAASRPTPAAPSRSTVRSTVADVPGAPGESVVLSDSVALGDEGQAILAQCRRSAAFSLWSMVASVVVLFTVIMVGGAAERLFVSMMLPDQSSVADRTGGLLRSQDGFFAGPNLRFGTRRIGSSGHAGIALCNVLLFPLPAMDALDHIESAELAWTFKVMDGEPAFSVDLYGLGYVGERSFRGQVFWEGDQDRSFRWEYGMQGARSRRVELLARGVMSPDSSTGRVVVDSPAMVAFMRSLYADGAAEGDLVAFRLNADSSTTDIVRATGYAVVHPPVLPGKTQASEMPTLRLTASRAMPQEAFVAEAVLSANEVIEHWGGGLVRSAGGAIVTGGNSDLGTRRIGSSSLDRIGLGNVLLFHLPPRSELEQVRFAQLEWTYRSKDGAPKFSVDLYGLGCVDAHSLDSLPFWEGDYDASLRSEYGMDGAADRPVALLARGVMAPETDCGRIVVENDRLIDFLQSLYDDGAQGGELVAFRLNADSQTTDIERATGYTVIHGPARPGKTLQSDLPVLRMTAQ